MSRLDELMVKVYTSLIQKGAKKIEDVPEKIRKSVEKALQNG